MKIRSVKWIPVLLTIVLMTAAALCGCEKKNSTAGKDKAPDLAGLAFESELPLDYATGFSAWKYRGGYTLIRVRDSADYLVVPENAAVPEISGRKITVLQKPLDHIYLAATSSMALFDALGALDHIKMSGTDRDGWYVENARKAMENGSIVYAGKYSEPDYEMLVNDKCDLAVESTMILHTPEVQKMIEQLGIPVFTDRSSYEEHPLGRTEWIKLYGILAGKEEEADAFFRTQASSVEKLKDFPNTEKTVAFFYISSDGSAVIRNPGDYISRMIEIAGGRNAFQSTGTGGTTGATVKLSMEEFYAAAKDADCLIYDSAIDPVSGLSQLTEKNRLFSEFKAVQNGNVWATGESLYQRTDILGQWITDVHLILTDGPENEMTFLHRLN